MGYFDRNLGSWLEKTLKTRPLVYLNGPRQCGKTTLTEKGISKIINKKCNHINFDSPLDSLAAKTDPQNFIDSLPKNTLNIIDEIQIVPEIFTYLKMEVDKSRSKGKAQGLFLLTGSANLLALPKLAQALVGRMSVLTLLPFSSSEYKKTGVNFITKLFNEKFEYHTYKPYKLLDIILNSTFPEPALNHNIDRRQWFGDYLNMLLQRDICTVSEIRNPSRIVKLLSILAVRAGSLLNNSLACTEAGLDIKTYEKYKAAAVNTFIIFEIPAWSKPAKINKRFTKSAKIFFTDTNLLSYLLKRDLQEIYKNDSTNMGHIFENFIATEIMKNLSSLPGYEVSHFRTSDNKEVDFVIENEKHVIGIEVKLSLTIDNHDFAGLKILKEAVGKRFKQGVVIYPGTKIVPFGENLWAVPVCYLWG